MELHDVQAESRQQDVTQYTALGLALGVYDMLRC
jgi:hypothetical protein